MGADAPALAAAPGLQAVQWKRVATFGMMVVGMFMAMLDIQIVASSLTQIQVGLSANADEVVWVQTAYLIAETVMIPLSSFLSRALSLRVAFALSAIAFTAASLLCASAQTIEQLILFRAIQGFVGGVMVPSVYASAYLVFGQKKIATASIIMGMIVTLAPTIGPTFGGWLTDTFSWRWLFLINLVPGIAITLGILAIGRLDEPDLPLLRKIDLPGLTLMALFLGGMSFVLEEGARKSWFEDDAIRVWTAVMLVSGTLFFWRVLTAEEPVIRLSPMRDFNFSVGLILSALVGFAMFGFVFISPLFLARVGHLSASQVGAILVPTGVVMVMWGPVTNFLSKRVDPRMLQSIGFALIALSAWITIGNTAEWRFDELLLPQILRGIGMMLVLPTIMMTCFTTLPPALMKDASALLTLIRNLGGAFGIAAFNTLLLVRGNFHWSRLAEAINPARDEVIARFELLRQMGVERGLADPEAGALRALAGNVLQQATVMSFSDCFVVMTLLMLVAIGLPYLLSRPSPTESAGH